MSDRFRAGLWRREARVEQVAPDARRLCTDRRAMPMHDQCGGPNPGLQGGGVGTRRIPHHQPTLTNQRHALNRERAAPKDRDGP